MVNTPLVPEAIRAKISHPAKARIETIKGLENIEAEIVDMLTSVPKATKPEDHKVDLESLSNPDAVAFVDKALTVFREQNTNDAWQIKSQALFELMENVHQSENNAQALSTLTNGLLEHMENSNFTHRAQYADKIRAQIKPDSAQEGDRHTFLQRSVGVTGPSGNSR